MCIILMVPTTQIVFHTQLGSTGAHSYTYIWLRHLILMQSLNEYSMPGAWIEEPLPANPGSLAQTSLDNVALGEFLYRTDTSPTHF